LSQPTNVHRPISTIRSSESRKSNRLNQLDDLSNVHSAVMSDGPHSANVSPIRVSESVMYPARVTPAPPPALLWRPYFVPRPSSKRAILAMGDCRQHLLRLENPPDASRQHPAGSSRASPPPPASLLCVPIPLFLLHPDLSPCPIPSDRLSCPQDGEQQLKLLTICRSSFLSRHQIGDRQPPFSRWELGSNSYCTTSFLKMVELLEHQLT
jgi:hypothetical protein